jgi:hypothetical protein
MEKYFVFLLCIGQNWASEIALRGVFFLAFFYYFILGGSLIICDEPRDKNVDAPFM